MKYSLLVVEKLNSLFLKYSSFKKSLNSLISFRKNKKRLVQVKLKPMQRLALNYS